MGPVGDGVGGWVWMGPIRAPHGRGPGRGQMLSRCQRAMLRGAVLQLALDAGLEWVRAGVPRWVAVQAPPRALHIFRVRAGSHHPDQIESSCLAAVIPPQKQMTGMLGHPVAENPIDRMFDAVYAHYGLPWQFWKNDIANTDDLALAVQALRPLG